MIDDRNKTPVAEEERPIPKRVEDRIDEKIDEHLENRVDENQDVRKAREVDERVMEERADRYAREQAEMAARHRPDQATAENRHMDNRVDRLAADRMANERADTVADAVRPERTYAPRASRFIYWLLGVVESLLAVRLILRLIDANSGNSIVSVIYGITDVLIAPFRGIVAQSQAPGFDVQTLVAMVGYLIVGVALAKLIDVLTPSRY